MYELVCVNEMQNLLNGYFHNYTSGLKNGNPEEPENAKHGGEVKKVEELFKNRIHAYVDSFTIHGLTRVVTAPRYEALLWLMTLLLGVFLSVMIVRNLVTKYRRYDVYNDIRSIVTKKNTFPSLTICEKNLFEHITHSYCGISLKDESENTEWNKPCDYETIYHASENVTTTGSYNNSNTNWSNGLFQVLSCQSWDGGDCLGSRYMKSHHRLNGSCITWNYKGDFHGEYYGHVELKLKFLKPELLKTLAKHPKIVAFLHDPELTDIDLTKALEIRPTKQRDISFLKTKIVRQPPPYPSGCAEKGSAEAFDILSGGYSRHSCVESHKLMTVYKECGDTLDYVRPFIPNDVKIKYQRNSNNNNNNKNSTSILETKRCIRRALARKSVNTMVTIRRCPFPCHEINIQMQSIESDVDGNGAGTGNKTDAQKQEKEELTYNINLQFQSVDTFRLFQEKPLYSLPQMMSEIGGFLGLVIGASLLSFIELIVCSAFALLKMAFTKMAFTRK